MHKKDIYEKKIWEQVIQIETEGMKEKIFI